MAKILNLKSLIIIIFILIGSGLVEQAGLFSIDKHLRTFQFVTLIMGIYALLCVIEVISVAREERHRAKNLKDSSVGKKGIVIEDCSPEGTAKIGQEIWKALTACGSTFKKGEEIIILERQGLKLIVKSLSSDHPRI